MLRGNLAALVTALSRLRIEGESDAELITALRVLLGQNETPVSESPRFGNPAQGPQSSRGTLIPQTKAPELSMRQATVRQLPSTASRDLNERAKSSTVSDLNKLVALDSSFEQIGERADLDSQTRAGVESQRPHSLGIETPLVAAPIHSLFPSGRVRAIMRETTALALPAGEIDLVVAVKMIARADPIASLPRKLISKVGQSITLLFDTGPTMLPFTRDKQQLSVSALRLLGSDRVRIGDFTSHPLAGIRPPRSVRWEPFRWPSRRSSIVVVSDLGIGAPEGLGTHSHEAWRRFNAEARVRGVRTVLLIPYPPERWPSLTSRFDAAVTWDVVTGVQSLRRMMRSRSSALFA